MFATATIGGTGYTTTYQYNPVERLFGLTFGSAWARFASDENGSITGTQNSNGTQSNLRYDDAGKLTNIRLTNGNGYNIGEYTHSYDGNGNITSIALRSDSFGSKTATYNYDALNRLTRETLRDGTIKEYSYDTAGNRTQRKVTLPNSTIQTSSYTYDAANQMLSVNTNTGYTYDANGNMTSDGSRSFQNDVQNRLTRVTRISDGGLIASYEYDADGRRTSKTTPTATTKYYYDGDSTRVLYETNGTGTLLVRYIYDAGDYKPVAMVRGGITYFYHYNFRGDVVALTDSSGAVVAEYDYDAYGLPVTTGLEGSVVNPYRYAGYYWDDETSFYYLNARYYWPNVGRFVTRAVFMGFRMSLLR